MPRFDLTTIGEGNIKLSVPRGRLLEEARSLDVRIAGAEANVSAALSRLGRRCGWISRLPRTPLGRRIANEYLPTGLDLSAVEWVDSGRLAALYVEYASSPASTQVIFDRADSAFSKITPEHVDWDYLLDTRLIHLTGITAALSDSCREVLAAALRRAGERGVPVSFDVNYRRRLWSAAEAGKTLLSLIRGARGVEILFCRDADAREVFGVRGSTREAAEQLKRITGARKIVLSAGAAGATALDGEEWFEEAAREVNILDRIGAGDALAAGVIHAWLGGKFAEGLKYGTAMAALALTRFGEIVLTTPEELERLAAGGTGQLVR